MDSVNKWLTLAANIGVIVGIAFLAVELNQNNTMLRSQAQYNALQNRNYIAELEAEDPTYAAIVIKDNNGIELSDLEELRLNRTSRIFINNWEYEYLQFLEGNLELKDIVYSQLINRNSRILQLFNENKQFRDPRFVEYIESLVVNK